MADSTAVEGDSRYLTTAEVAHRLDVKEATVYAYVSRGLLRSVRARGGRGSVFRQDEVEGLADRRRDGRQASGAVERIRTELTLIADDELYFRGHRAVDLATTTTVESVAHLLWTGDLADRPPFPAPADLVESAEAAIAVLPRTARLTDRLRVAVVALGALDPLRFALSPESVIRAGETLLGVLAAAHAPHAPQGDTVALRVWPVLTSRPVRARLLTAVLILLADHDLAVSTVAARIAANTRANPYAVVSAGLGALDGPRHGAASSLAYRFLGEALSDPIDALSDRLRTSGTVPGFGHRVYQRRDPRAELLITLLRESGEAETPLRALDAVTERLRDQNPSAFPNIDLALAAMMHAYDMRPDAGEAVFAVSRAVGWLAHAIEEYREPALRFRPVGVYTGARPAH
ncbi:citrate synthase [Actinoalloteichus hoggarensis]|uniref:citrate synthase (unknown stereospecificity) n=1 Tax=Actinoalloteichus hoggarensis TaxID=1470176 RepID=A0A221W3H1_9PSEU|nr:citrate/2-methylcitrate synthase [Actinoalloteichus hoggarensis]ASO20304.1 Citrate synthase 2 [Actinoalloteichus hoggarensis]MBB5918982.1 citrate synthase [Actinoalloteichus hoggarensis]